MGVLPDAVRAAFVKRVLDEREAAGLPRHLDDDAVLDRIVAIVTSPPAPQDGSNARAGT